MSKAATKDVRKKVAAQRSAEQWSNDIGVYSAIVMFGLFALGLWYLLDVRSFPHAVVGFAIAVLGMINFFAFKAWRGSSLAGWQQSLARVALRPAGFGTKSGRPIEAAKQHDAARTAVMLSSIISLVVIVGLALAMIPNLM